MTWQDGVVPDVAAPIVGYRYWAADPEGGLISPMFQGTRWERGEVVTAACQRDRFFGAPCGTVPCPPPFLSSGHVGLGCGLYAYKTVEGLLTNASLLCRVKAVGATLVLGEVDLWGRVYEYSHGYRAQHARPRAVLAASRVHAVTGGLRPRRRRVAMPPASRARRAATVMGLPVVDVDDIEIPEGTVAGPFRSAASAFASTAAALRRLSDVWSDGG